VATATLQEGIDAYNGGQPLQALTLFGRIVHNDPMSAEPAIWAGIAAIAAGRNDEADAYFREGLRRPHTDFQDRVTQGWLNRLSVLREPAPITPVPSASPSEIAQKAIAALARAANPRLKPEQAIWLGEHVVAAAQREGLDPWLLAAVVYIESHFNHTSRSRAGAIGLGQLMPGTARAAGVNAKDPWGNLLGSAMMLRGYYLKFGDWRLALAAYNAGEYAVRRFGGIPPYAETRWYVSAVWTIYHQIRPNV
jgi:soluble lytic murein transglycosylase-like protein